MDLKLDMIVVEIEEGESEGVIRSKYFKSTPILDSKQYLITKPIIIHIIKL